MTLPLSAPPSFEEAGRLRQKARASGLDLNYWYAVEEVRKVAKGSVVEVVFWKQSIALFRTEEGTFHAVDNRCAHRQIKLSLGDVKGCRLVCAYHGWEYDTKGTCVEIPHNRFGRGLPKFTLRSYPVKVRYGLVWMFPGDPELAEERQIPDIPELEGPDRWACVPLVYTWRAHHSMILENVCDFTHAHLHRRHQLFDGADLTRCETVDNKVHVAYDSKVGRGRVSSRFVEHDRINTGHIELCLEYPYQWSNIDDAIKHWLFVIPLNERTTRVFFLFYFKSLKLPLLPIRIPRVAMSAAMKISNRYLIGRVLNQDRFAVEAEQEGYEKYWAAPQVEFNPVVPALQSMLVNKWQDYLASDEQSG